MSGRQLMSSKDDALCCMALLETVLADAYERAASSVEDPALKATLEFISADSAKHARVLEALGSGTHCAREQCRKLMGVAWESEVEAAERVSDFEALMTSYDEMNRLECAAGEEYSMPAYIAAEELRGTESRLVSELLRMISEDEGRHARLLSHLRKELGHDEGDT